ncbi:transposase [Streptomyces cellulosae]|uniref:transposase n=1 Tax=Streptomyces cellulosae TaxID=1968 RepID=UPI00131D5C1E
MVAQFASTDCRACPSRTQCTSSRRVSRILTLRPKELHEIQTAARAEQKIQTWRDKYKLPAWVEGTINQALDMTGIRRARYRGLAKVRLQHLFPPPPRTSSASTPTGAPPCSAGSGPADSNAGYRGGRSAAQGVQPLADGVETPSQVDGRRVRR